MIGIGSLLARSILGVLLLGLMGGAVWRACRGRGRGWYLSVAAALLPGFAGYALLEQVNSNVKFVSELRHLQGRKVSFVVVGNSAIADDAALQKIVQCLATATWFDRRSGPFRPFEVVYKDGDRRHWRIAALDDGAVIDFGLTQGDFGIYQGAAYSSCLPAVLRETKTWTS